MTKKSICRDWVTMLICELALFALTGCFSVDASGRRIAECDKMDRHAPKGWAEFHLKPTQRFISAAMIRKKGDSNIFIGADALNVTSGKPSYIRIAAKPDVEDFRISWRDTSLQGFYIATGQLNALSSQPIGSATFSVPISEGMITPVEIELTSSTVSNGLTSIFFKTIISSPIPYTPIK